MNCPYCNQPTEDKADSEYIRCFNCPGTPSLLNWEYYESNIGKVHLSEDDMWVQFYADDYIIEFYPNNNKTIIASKPIIGQAYHLTFMTFPKIITPNNYRQILKLKAFL